MKATPSGIVILCLVIANILACIYVDRHGGAEGLFAGTNALAVCLAWIIANLLCFFLYIRLRRRK